MKKFVEISNTIGIIAGFVGIVTYYWVTKDLVIWLAAISLITSFINVIFGEQNSLISEFLAMGVGLAVAVILNRGIINYIALALCFENALLSLFALIVTLRYFIAKFVLLFKKKDVY